MTYLAKEKHRARCRDYYQKNRDKILKRVKENSDPKLKWEYMLQYKFGITVEAYEAMLIKQKGVCAICLKPPSGRFKRLAVDHCHKTGKIRGLLCSGCNRAIGYLEDSSEILLRASSYLSEES